MRVLRKILGSAGIFQIIEVDRHPPAGLHQVHQAEVVEGRDLVPITFGKVHRERGRAGKAPTSLLPVAFGEPVALQFSGLVGVALQRERELAAPASALRIVIQFPMIARAVVADRGGTKLAGNERRDESAATRVLARNQAHRQPRAGLLTIHVQTKRPDGPSARAGLFGPEKSEEHASAGTALRQRESARGAQFIIQRPRADLVRIKGRLGGAPDLSAHFSRGFACEMASAVAKILSDGRILFRHNTVIERLPPRIAIKGLGSLFSVGDTDDRCHQQRRKNESSKLVCYVIFVPHAGRDWRWSDRPVNRAKASFFGHEHFRRFASDSSYMVEYVGPPRC